MFKTDADETKILVEKLLDENERRSMNLFRLILSGFAPFAFSDGKEFIIMQTCETTPIWAWFGADISDAAAENAADIIADRLSKCADVQFNADPNRAKKTLEILKNKHGISAEKRMAMTAYVCRKSVVPAAKGEMTNPAAEDKQTVADLLVQLVEDGKKIGCPVLSYIRRGDDGIFEEGFADGSSGEFVYHTSIEREGYVHLTVTACDEHEAPLKGYEIFEGGACAGFDDIRAGVNEPEDFDKFWNDTIKNELDTVSPVVLEKKEFSSGDPGDVVYDIKVACAGKYPVSGYLRLPRDAREGELPIIVRYIGYSVDTAPIPPKKRAIQFSINPHGINNGESSKYYDNLEKNELSAFGFRNEENASPETVYFKYMVLRAIQALRFCKTIPLWDKKNIILVGGSMGAMQAVSAAAHDDGVTRLEIEIPWLCDLRGIEKGRLEGWRPENSRGMDYYDTVYQAARVKCETFITAGLGDYICPPSGVTALYHALGGKKHLTMQQNRTHPYIAPEFEVYER